MIISIEQRRGSKTRFDVRADDEYIFTAERKTLREFGIYEGGEIDDAADLWELVEEAEYAAALERSYTYLEARMRSEKELRQNLKRLGFVDSIIERVIVKLADIGFVDDLAFSQSWAESKLRNKSMRAVIAELKYKGVASETLEEIKALEQEDDEVGKCVVIARRYLRGREDAKTELRKAAQACARKGYDWDTIRNALARLDLDPDEE